MNIEDMLFNEAQRYEQFAKNTQLAVNNTDQEITKILREIENEQIQLDKYQKDYNEMNVQKEQKRFNYKKTSRRVQSMSTMPKLDEQTIDESKNSALVSNGSGTMECLMSKKATGSNPSTMDQSLIINSNSIVSAFNSHVNWPQKTSQCKTGQFCNNTEFGTSAKINNFSFVDLPHNNSNTSKQSINLSSMKPKILFNKNFINESKKQTQVFRMNEEKLLTFSESINPMTDSSRIMPDSKISQIPPSKPQTQRYNSCHKLTTNNSNQKPRSKHRVCLPITFTNLDEILNINPSRNSLRLNAATRMVRKN